MFGAVKVNLAAFFGALWIRSLRVRFNAPDDYRPGVLGLWHQDLLASCAAFKHKNVHVLISESGDGEIFARATERLGYRVTRGSDSHGSTNVRHLLRTLKNGGFVGMALDGPHGPAHEVKPGSFWLSEASGRPLWLIGVRYGRCIRLKTWDNFIVPLPLTTIDIQIKYFFKADEKTLDKEIQP